MSYTEIYKFNKIGEGKFLAEVSNAWRGAMAIWNFMDEKYLPPFMPSWAFLDKDRKDRYYRSCDAMGEGLKEVWGLWKNGNVSLTDKIVLGTTFDKVTVSREHMPCLIKAFREFEGQTSLKEQADILEAALNDEDLIAIAWNQTSVNYDAWDNIGGYDEEKEESIPYNILNMNDHWGLFEELEEAGLYPASGIVTKSPQRSEDL